MDTSKISSLFSETKNPTSEIEKTSIFQTEIPLTEKTTLRPQTTETTISTNITLLSEQSTKTYSTETQGMQTSEPDTPTDPTLIILLSVLIPTSVFSLSIGIYLLYKFKFLKKFTSVKPDMPKTESIPLN
jgi:hypothetical protein